MKHRLAYLTASLLLLSLGAACGDDETTPATGGSNTGGEAAGGGGEGGGVVAATLESARAPDETTVLISLGGGEVEPPSATNAYTLESTKGALTVGEVSYDAATRTITLTTSQQKLGVEYTLQILSPGHPLDLQTAKLWSADTATFWATDFGSPSFEDYEVVAERVGVGENIVVYTTAEGEAYDVEEAIAYFDEEIFPTETALYVPAPDRDDNGKIVVLGLDGGGYYAGYFSPIDSVSEAQAQQWGYHSNEMEMLYISVVDLGGSLGAESVIAHEFSHLLYNENHDFFTADWSWHNEGLAECAVHAVSGSNDYAAEFYVSAAGLANGQSLVNWVYSNYDQYAQAYVFLTYAASRLGGVDGYGAMFQLEGDPASVGELFTSELGRGFSELQLDMLTAVWLQEASGPNGFNGMLSLPAGPQTATSSPLELETFEGVFFPGAGDGLTPTGAGPDVIFRAIDGAGAIDDSAPYDAQGGVVIALRTASAPAKGTQSTGTFSMGAAPAPSAAAPRQDRAWMHPPPLKPANLAALRAWRRQVHGF